MRRDRDRRKVELQLTDSGRKVIESLIPLAVKELNLALEDFSSAEVAEFVRLLMKFNTTHGRAHSRARHREHGGLSQHAH